MQKETQVRTPGVERVPGVRRHTRCSPPTRSSCPEGDWAQSGEHRERFVSAGRVGYDHTLWWFPSHVATRFNFGSGQTVATGAARLEQLPCGDGPVTARGHAVAARAGAALMIRTGAPHGPLLTLAAAGRISGTGSQLRTT